MIKDGKLVATGVRVGALWDGKCQGAAHIREGLYWVACYSPTYDERMVQRVLLDKRYPPTNEHRLVREPWSARVSSGRYEEVKQRLA